MPRKKKSNKKKISGPTYWLTGPSGRKYYSIKDTSGKRRGFAVGGAKGSRNTGEAAFLDDLSREWDGRPPAKSRNTWTTAGATPIGKAPTTSKKHRKRRKSRKKKKASGRYGGGGGW